MPMMAFIGVRISWLMLARKSDLALVAASAASLATARSAACIRVCLEQLPGLQLAGQNLGVEGHCGQQRVEQCLLTLRDRSRRGQFDDRQHNVLINHRNKKDAGRCRPHQHPRRLGMVLGGGDNLKSAPLNSSLSHQGFAERKFSRLRRDTRREGADAREARVDLVGEVERTVQQIYVSEIRDSRIVANSGKSSADCNRSVVAATSALTQPCVSRSRAATCRVCSARLISPISLGRSRFAMGWSSRPSATSRIRPRNDNTTFTTSTCTMESAMAKDAARPSADHDPRDQNRAVRLGGELN